LDLIEEMVCYGEIFLAFLGSICPGVIYNVEKRNLMWVGFGGMLGWITYRTFNEITRVLYLHLFWEL